MSIGYKTIRSKNSETFCITNRKTLAMEFFSSEVNLIFTLILHLYQKNGTTIYKKSFLVENLRTVTFGN